MMTGKLFEKLTSFSCLTLFLLAPPSVGASENDWLEEAVGSFLTAYEQWDGAGLRRSAEKLDSVSRLWPGSYPAHYWRGVAWFHYALNLMAADEADRRAYVALDAAESALERALALKPACGECQAVMASIIGLRIARRPLTAVWRGPAFKRRSAAALRLSPGNPRVHYLTGSSYYHAPGLLGGRSRALEHFFRAEILFEKERLETAEPLAPRWGYAACLVFIGDIYRENGELKKAREYLERTLAVNPNNRLARQKLVELSKTGEADE